MAEEAVVEQPQTPAQPEATPFGSSSWTETPPALPKQEQTPPATPTPATPAAATPPPVVNEEIVDPKEWLKREFEVDDPALIKQQLKELNELREKAKTPAQVQYANEQSRKFHEALIAGKEDEVYNFLHEKKKLEKLTSPEVTRLSAEEIIKFSIYQKNKDLSPDEIDFVFNERFSFPPKPIQDAAELDGDYEARVNEWKGRVDAIEKKLVIEAKMARPELEKLKAELVLPEIQKGVDPKEAEAQQKELERVQNLRNQYLKHLESDYKNFNGYEVKYKDEEVEIPVSFAVTPEEQVALKTELESFNIDDFISGRWFKADGSPNVQQIMSDVTLLRKGESVLQKVANEVGTKMKEHYIQKRGNIEVKGDQKQTFQPGQNGGQAAPSPFAMGSWSETPPALVN